MFFSINNKNSQLSQKVIDATPRSRFLSMRQLDILYNDKVLRDFRKLKNAVNAKINELHRFNLDEVESAVNSYLKLMEFYGEGLERLEGIVKDFDKMQEKVKIESQVQKAKLRQDDFKQITYAVRNKCQKSLKEIKEQLHFMLDYSLGIERMEFQGCESIYNEFKSDMNSALASVEKQALRQFKESQLSKSIELAQLDKENERKKDIDRDQQIAEAKKQFNKQIETYDQFVQDELERYRGELEIKHKHLDKKVSLIDDLLKEKQKELLNDLIEKSDGIINELAEQKTAAILKKLGVKL